MIFACQYEIPSSKPFSLTFLAEHEERQNRLRALRNRQDLFQEEGILNLILDAIDNINTITSQGFLVTLASEESGSQNFDVITSYLYQLLAAIIKGNHTNCAQFANVNRLNWLFSRLGSQASGEGSGMLDVLHCVLIDSPEALNMMRVRFKSLIYAHVRTN
jgi:ryanodine receptor 2